MNIHKPRKQSKTKLNNKTIFFFFFSLLKMMSMMSLRDREIKAPLQQPPRTAEQPPWMKEKTVVIVNCCPVVRPSVGIVITKPAYAN